MIDDGIDDPVELDTYLTGLVDVVRDMVELMNGDRKLQPCNRQEREPNGSTPLFWFR